MNLEQLYNNLKNPHLIGEKDVSPLKELTVKYPYSQLFSILYLKALANSKNLHFEDEIQNHAFKITDRAKLVDLLQTNNAQDNSSEKSEHEILETQISEKENLVEEKIIVELEEIIDENQVENSEAQEEIQPEEIVKTEGEKVENSLDLELEKEFLSNIVASSYSLEIEEKNLPSEEKTVDKGEINLSENRSFSSWLKAGNTEPKAKNQKIIEKFIQEEPERIKPKTEFFSVPKIAKESVSEEKLVFSETLANIYALQGNFPKAIHAFEQLMLTIPEKKRYFAKKIEELNKKINS